MVMARTAYNTYRDNNVPYSNPSQTTRFKPQQMDERRANDLYFNCDNKYSKGHKCGS